MNHKPKNYESNYLSHKVKVKEETRLREEYIREKNYQRSQRLKKEKKELMEGLASKIKFEMELEEMNKVTQLLSVLEDINQEIIS